MQPLLETTRLSSKGQVVLPLAIRRRLHLPSGAKFAVMGEGDTVILKKIALPSTKPAVCPPGWADDR
jgi:AbrB family looped-hinge helix DNA binding protein